MKNWMIASAFAFVSSVSFAAPSVVEGKVDKIVEKKTEIYVKDSSGKKHEYYFNKETKVLKGEQTLAFSDLKVGQSVRVTAEKIGKRLDPKQVEILE